MRRSLVLLVVLSACSKFLGLDDVTYEGGDAGPGSNPPDPASGTRAPDGVCGDGVKTGSEQCDDGNRVPFDGCSPTCTIEPVCPGGTCIATCGDGLVFAQEECDDGNLVNGDGCDRNCKLELNSGFLCEPNNQPPPSTLVIPILYRDMLYSGTPSPPFAGPGHPDFESFNNGIAHGLVQSMLGSDSKPVWKSDSGDNPAPLLTDRISFCWWYHDAGCDGADSTNPFARPVVLDAAGSPTTLTLIQRGANAYQFNSQRFFPLDGRGWNGIAEATPQTDLDIDGLRHNFAFTSELHYPFTYVAGNGPTLDFTGDDDVWVFINGHLAVDLGGVHAASNGRVTLDATRALIFGLVSGGTYSLDIFQAERHTRASTYQLTLSGFAHAVTTCSPICGDGRVVGNEVCDDGPRNGLPGQCNTTCSGRG